TMSGGGRSVARGGMAYSVPQGAGISAARLKELDDLLSKLNAEIGSLMQSRRTLELELDTLSSEIHNSKIALQRSENAFQTLMQMKEEAADVIKSAEACLAYEKEEAEEIQTILSSKKKVANAQMAEARSNAESVELEVRDLEQRIFETGGQELQDQIKLVQSIKDHIENLKDRITRHQVDKDASLKAAEDA
ncbi:hypothetical protein BVRB_031140, partial [Beta vulgaris subsp. vulgaris]